MDDDHEGTKGEKKNRGWTLMNTDEEGWTTTTKTRRGTRGTREFTTTAWRDEKNRRWTLINADERDAKASTASRVTYLFSVAVPCAFVNTRRQPLWSADFGELSRAAARLRGGT